MTANPADINMPAELAPPVGALPPLLFDMHAEIHAWPSTSEVTLEASDDLAMFQGDGNAVVMPTSMHENAGPVPGTNASGANVGDTNSKTRGGTFERQPEKRILVIPSPPPHMRPRRVLKPKVDVSAEARGQSFYIPG
ncbi:hypothetical protein WOLCODRAFT_141275 [Wolfiporia cocos MD-104 SS10]|uniref:Uncharacterized protein n=1 Tax=Wolfiporia cocos (strain MD-104) TaxID=742152 RepID=A0A2H3JB82_WOLCO|nr:hypothetical protein WOLCODRAFT_141275 [Wolfiporia cocos MD-104 SS10]